MYSLGQFGWSLANSCIMLLVIYFYIPPDTGTIDNTPEFIERNIIFLSFTVVGLLMFAGTLISAVFDIIMGPVSDRANYRFGRRRTFLAVSFPLIVITTIMAFFPPFLSNDPLNIVWLSAAVIGFNIFLSVYVTPYNGLIAEIGHTQNERVLISTLLAVTWGLGMVTANTVFVLKEKVSEWFSLEGYEAFQYIILAYGILAFLLMSLPVIFINENKYCVKTDAVEGNPWQQMIAVFKIENFRNYMWAELLYWFSVQFVQLGVAYYTTTLVGLEERFTTFVVMGIAAFAFMTFPLMMPLTRRFTKKQLMLAGFILLVLQFSFISILGLLKIPLWATGVIIVSLYIFPMAIFGILPMALVSDMATEDANKTGKFRSATFFGVKFFMMKVGISLTNLLFPTLLLFGNSVENNTGVRLTAVMGLVGSFLAYFVMRRVKEPEVHPG